MKKKQTRQQKWQIRKRKEGKCIICGQPLFSKNHCYKHLVAARGRSRAYSRKKLGIDVNAPLDHSKGGRKRTEEA